MNSTPNIDAGAQTAGPTSTMKLGRWRWAVSGLIAGGFGLAFAEVFVGLTKGFTSPILSVGDKAIDLVPVPIKNFAIRTFGTHDKQALLVGIFTAIVAFALIVGLVGRKRLAAAIVGFGAFGVLGALAAVTGRTGSIGDAIPSLLAIVVAIAVYVFLRSRLTATPAPVVGETAVADTAVRGRRQFLAAGAVLAAGAAGLGAVGRTLQSGTGAIAKRLKTVLPKAKSPIAPLLETVSFPELSAATPFITPNKDFYKIDTALVVPKIDSETWTLKIKGRVGMERTYTYEDLLSRNLVERDITLTCVSNEVGGILMGTARWLGVPLRELLAEAEADPKATQIVGRSVDGWTSGFPMSAVSDGRDTLVAIGMNGEPLPFDHGFPARLIVPGLYGYVSATKWLTEIEVTDMESFDAYWVPRGYAKKAPIKMASRIDVPRGLATVPPGRTAVAGVAWAQRKGISKVEVSIDNGAWNEAELADEVSKDTWRQWRYVWDAAPGRHDIAVRAYDRKGTLQTEERVAPLPNGATGWHSIIVLVSES
jgi:DMSO/TMAO reductase YedYZ molybdopterin-dependent catalytic subunit